METSVVVQLGSDRYARVAGTVHTIFALIIMAAWTFLGRMVVDQMAGALNPPRIRLYLLTLVFEWFLFAYMIVGVRRSAPPSQSL
jgi:hypothetical protein